MAGMKRCPHCERDLPLDRFHKDRTKVSGRVSWCKDCANARDRAEHEPAQTMVGAKQCQCGRIMVGRRRRFCNVCQHFNRQRWTVGHLIKSRGRHREKTHRKRAAVWDGQFTSEQEEALRAEAISCPLCGIELNETRNHPRSKNLDHIVPLGIGGAHTRANVRIICQHCNHARPNDGSDLDPGQGEWATDELRAHAEQRAIAARHRSTQSTVASEVAALERIGARARREERQSRVAYALWLCREGVPVAAAAHAADVPSSAIYRLKNRRRSSVCAGCGCDTDSRTLGCKRCSSRHSSRRRTSNGRPSAPGTPAPSACKGCGCPLDHRTPSCPTCRGRHKLRRRALRRHDPIGAFDLQEVAGK